MIFGKFAAASLLNIKHTKMSFSLMKNCHNLCTVLRKCLAEDPNLDLLIERTVSVRCVEEEEKILISTRIDGKPKHYTRMKHEPLKNTLSRIHISLVNPNNKKKSKKKLQHDLELGLAQTQNEHKYPDDVFVGVKKLQGLKYVTIDEETTNIEAWTKGNVLVIGDVEFRIKVNAPAVVSASLPKSLMAGFPIVPNLDLEFAERESSKFMWLRTMNYQHKMASEKGKKGGTKKDDDCCEKNLPWEFITDKFNYTPKNSDIGHKLKFVCVPKRADVVGFSHEVISSVDVEAGPGICPFDERHLYTVNKLSDKNQFRVISYNILADIYCATEFAQQHLYPYCSKYATEFDYRGQLILKELLGYNSDIICLQECDLKVFDHFLQPALNDEGFTGHYMRKAGEMPEGEALFYNKARFSLIEESNVIISEAISLPCNESILLALESCPELLESLKKRTAIGQIVALRDKMHNEPAICMLNTHLYFRPEATNIRLLQIAVLLNCLQDLFKKIKNKQEEGDSSIKKIAVLICGDLNSTPDKAVVEYLLNGFIPSEHNVWNSGETNEKSINIDLKHNFKLFSACGFPKFTNYVVGFKDTLDYILPDSLHFNVKSFVPFPNEDVLSLHTALPSITVPSDHLALVCDLSWRE